MPPLNPRTVVNKGKVGVAGERGKGRDEKEVFEAFEGPSKPRLIYERPGGRELPKVRVSPGGREGNDTTLKADGDVDRGRLRLVGRSRFSV